MVSFERDRVMDNAHLLAAAQGGDMARVKELLGFGADPNYGAFEKGSDYGKAAPFRLAAENGHTDVVRVLLDKVADVNVMHDVAIGEAAFGGYADLVELLLERGADPNGRGSDPNGGGNVNPDAPKLGRPLFQAIRGRIMHPGVWGVIRPTPENGHRDTINVLLRTNAYPPGVIAEAMRLAEKMAKQVTEGDTVEKKRRLEIASVFIESTTTTFPDYQI